jgi:hypothetical protein
MEAPEANDFENFLVPGHTPFATLGFGVSRREASSPLQLLQLLLRHPKSSGHADAFRLNACSRLVSFGFQAIKKATPIRD